MSFYEYAGNLHVHTSYSDGEATHGQVARAAAEAGLDFVVVTDHNVWVDGCESYQGKVLLLIGEELHDVRRLPQSNHLLAYNAESELVRQAGDPQGLIEAVNQRGGFSYLAHPYEYGSSADGGHAAIPWLDWDVTGYDGLEIWNYMSEFKALARNKLAAIYYAYAPARGIRGPFRAALRRWDQLLAEGKRVSAIGSSDAHGRSFSMGPLRRVLFPYEYLFRCVNTHVLTERPLNGVVEHDKELIYGALRAGHSWVGYDLPAPTAGFRFQARSGVNQAMAGDELVRTGAAIFEVHTPHSADIRLLFNGQVVARSRGQDLKFTSAQPGVYRVEAYRWHKLGRRGWIFSNPIYVV